MSPTSSSLTSSTTNTRVCAGDVARSFSGALFSSSCSETDCVATAVPVSESSHSEALGNRLHTLTQAQESPDELEGEASRARSSTIVQRQKSRRPYSARTQLLHQEERAQQLWETECLRVDATKITASTATQLNFEFHTVENEMSRDEFHHQMQDLDTREEEALDVQERSLIREARQELNREQLIY